MSRSSRAAKGFATSLLQSISQIVVQIVLAPVVLEVAGKEVLGAYAAITQAVALFSVIDVAGSWVLERFLGMATGREDDGQQFRTLFTIARTVQLVTNSLFALAVIGVSFFVPQMFHLSPGTAAQARYALYVVAAWAVLKTPFVAYANALIAMQDLAAVNSISAVANVMRGLASLIFVLMGTGLFGLMISGSVVDCIFSLLYRAYYQRKYPGLMPRWGIPDRRLFREMISFGGHAALINIGNKLFFNTANMVAALSKGAIAASVYYTSQAPTMTAYTVLSRLPNNAAPAIYEISGREDLPRLQNAFVRLIRIGLLLVMPLAVGSICFNRDVVTCWVGRSQFGGALLTITLAVFCVLESVRGIGALFAIAQGWTRLLTATALFQGFANIGLAMFFSKVFGIGGIPLALCIAVLPQTIIILRRISITLEVSAVSVISTTVLRLLFPLSAASLAGYLVHTTVRIRYHMPLGLIAECCTFLLVYASVAYAASLHEQERRDVKRWTTQALHRLVPS